MEPSMIRRFGYSLFFATIIFFTNSNAMKKGKPKNTPKSMPKIISELTQSLNEIAPAQEEYCSVPSEAHLEPYYEKLHEGFHEILAYKNSHRKLARNHFTVAAAGHIYNEEDGITTQLPYAPGYYALGVMALEDNNLDKAAIAFVKAVDVSSDCSQQRKVYLHSLFALGLMEIEQKNHADACYNLTHLYAHLKPNEYEAWQPKIRKKITEITDKIDVPWRKPLALLLNNDNKKRESALKAYQNCMATFPIEELTNNLKNFHETLLLTLLLADNNQSPHARVVIADLHAHQHSKKRCVFTLNPINPIEEFERALGYVEMDENSDFAQAKSVRGKIAYEYGRFLDTNSPTKDAPTRKKIRELFHRSALCGYEPGVGRYAHACLENEEEPLTHEQGTAHLEVLRRLSRGGNPHYQDALAKIFYFGHTFKSGYTVKSDMKEAYNHANNNLASIDMLVLQGVILMRGIKKENPQGKIIWDLEPNIQKGKLQIEKAIIVDQELTFIRLIEFIKENDTPPEIKDAIFKFVEKKQAEKKPNLCAMRSLGYMLLYSRKIDEGLKLLESISTMHNDPQGYCELSQIYRCGIEVEQDLKQAAHYCGKALTFFDKGTVNSNAAAQTKTHLQELLTTLNSAKHKDDEQTQKIIAELSIQMNLCGIRYIVVKKAKE
jgi:hypothetical protein